MLDQSEEAQYKKNPWVCPLADIAVKINKGGRGRSDAAEGGAASFLTRNNSGQPSIILDNGELRNSDGEVTVDTLKSHCCCSR